MRGSKSASVSTSIALTSQNIDLTFELLEVLSAFLVNDLIMMMLT
jgi:hypothetical protein